MAISSTALVTSIGRAQSYLNDSDPSTQPLMEFCVDAVSARIESWLDRKIVTQSFTELYEVGNRSKLILRNPKVSSITLLALDSESVLRAKYTGADTHASIEITDAAVVQRSQAGATTTTTTTTFAAQVTTTLMVSTMDAISGWEVTLEKAVPSSFLIRRGVTSAKDNEIAFEAWRWYEGDYFTDWEAGIIDFTCCVGWPYRPTAGRFSYGCPGWARVDYVAGFTTIPADVELAALDLLKMAWDGRAANASLESESLGDYAYRLAQEIEDREFQSVMTRLAKYERKLP